MRLSAAFPPAVLGAFALAVLLLAVVAVAAALGEHDLAFFTREPVTALQRDTCTGAACSYVGIVSNVGVLVWAAGATAAFLAAAASTGRRRSMLLAAGTLTVVLLADDMLLLHEYAWRELPATSESAIFAVYGVLIAAFALAFCREVAALDHAPLAVLALGLLGVSLVADRFALGGHLAEDGAKLLATVAWASFLVATALTARPAISRA